MAPEPSCPWPERRQRARAERRTEEEGKGVRSAGGLFTKVGSGGAVRVAVATAVTATAQPTLVTDGGGTALAAHTQPRSARRPRRSRGSRAARVRRASPSCASPRRRAARAAAERVLTAWRGAQAAAVPARRSRRPPSAMLLAGRRVPAWVWAESRSAERDRRPAAQRRPSGHMLPAICAAPPSRPGTPRRPLVAAGSGAALKGSHVGCVTRPEVRPREELPSVARLVYLTKTERPSWTA